MNDLTQGSVVKHLIQMAAFLAVSMVVQTLYLLADLFWVGRLGKEAIAAVGLAGNLTIIVLALTQMLGVGTTALISQAAGQKDQSRAELAFNQSFIMSILIAAALGVVGFLLRTPYCDTLSADATTAALARSYLLWFIPGTLLQFPLVTLGSAMRATGIVKPMVGLQVLSVALNMVLAPLLIFGLVGLPRLGVTGAALATFISILIADILMVIYFEKKYHYLRFRAAQWRPQIKTWWAMLRIGLPAGAEFALLFLYIVIVYGIIRGFGPAAQAGCPDSTFSGKYSGELRRLEIPQDRGRYGACKDYGPWTGSEYQGHANLPNGYWVYSYPHWIIYANRGGQQKQ